MVRKRIERAIIEKQCELCESRFEVVEGTRSSVKRFCTSHCAKRANGLANRGKKHSEESRWRRSIASTGENNPFHGKLHTNETKQRISHMKMGVTWEERMGIDASNERKHKQSENYSGVGNPFHGKSHTQETRQKITDAHVRNGDWLGERNPMYDKGYLIKGEMNPAWKGGISFGPYPESFSGELRTKIRQRDHFMCEICKKNGMCVHHIDYDKLNSDDMNLITLCQSCHTKTNFDRNVWQTYFSVIMENKFNG